MKPSGGDIARFAWLLRSYIKPYWRSVALLILGSYTAAALSACLPVLMAPILDLAIGTHGARAGTAPAAAGAGLSLKNLGAEVLAWLGVGANEERFAAIVRLCMVFVAVGVIKAGVEFGNYLIALWIRVRAGAAVQMDLFRHLMTLSMRFFTRHRTGELVSRLDNDTRSATAGLEIIVGQLLTAPVLIAVYGVLLVRTSPRLVFAAGAALVLHWLITRAVRGPIRRLATDQFSVFAELVAQFQETILSIRVVKSFGAEAFEATRVGRTLAEVLRVNVKFGIYKRAEQPARTIVNYVIEMGVLLMAAWELLAGHLTVATFFLFLYVGRAVMVQVGNVGDALSHIQTSLAASTRLVELLDQRPDVTDGAEPIDAFRERIVVNDVSFAYGAEPVLEGVSFEIARGELVALVGPSGSGKSTLADLILRFYDPTKGVITIDGRDLRTLRQESYRRLFGVVSQEALLFNASIRDNIAYGRTGLAEEQIVRAARIANAHDFISEFPEGYDTVVGDRGIRLSGGQRQRVAIARAIVGNPPILVLDEATSALDSESERLVQQAIDRVIEGATSIVIAHRLSTVLHADRIVVLNRGGVEAVGRHVELLAANETYARLYRLQFSEAEPLGRL